MSGDGSGGFNFGSSNPDAETVTNDTISATKLFSFKQYFAGLAHKDTIKMSWMFGGSLILPGTAQIYNGDYWKLPLIYGGIGGMIGGGFYQQSLYKRTGVQQHKANSTILFIGAAAFYYASIMDGIVCFDSNLDPDPTRATLYSALLPGLGQMYNGDYWHIPIWYTGLAVAGYAWNYNAKQYKRYRDLYYEAREQGNSYNGSTSISNLEHYRDTYRRMRDYSVLATVAVYLLQVIDANVFATMADFDMSDDISMEVGPAIITPISAPNYQQNLAINPQNSFGVQLTLTF